MKKYGKFAALIGIVLGTLVWLATASIGDNGTYYKTIAELGKMGNRAYGQRCRVAGDIEAGSIKHAGKDVQFILIQDKLRLNVVYSGLEPLPDTFREGSKALADGKLDKTDGVFHAAKIQAKCQSKYESKPGQMRQGQPAPNVNTGKTSI
jgi:cytochrome c-type biogenesis protein CcmE